MGFNKKHPKSQICVIKFDFLFDFCMRGMFTFIKNWDKEVKLDQIYEFFTISFIETQIIKFN